MRPAEREPQALRPVDAARAHRLPPSLGARPHGDRSYGVRWREVMGPRARPSP